MSARHVSSYHFPLQLSPSTPAGHRTTPDYAEGSLSGTVFNHEGRFGAWRSADDHGSPLPDQYLDHRIVCWGPIATMMTSRPLRQAYSLPLHKMGSWLTYWPIQISGVPSPTLVSPSRRSWTPGRAPICTFVPLPSPPSPTAQAQQSLAHYQLCNCKHLT
jgi:hypothetical protein